MNLKITLSVLRLLSHFNIRPLGIVPESRTDGGGAQINAIMSIRAFCKALKINYIHCPIKSIEHASDHNRAIDWENKFNLGYGAPSIQDVNCRVIHYKDIVSNFFSLRNFIVEIPHSHNFCDNHMDSYEKIIPEFKHAYRGDLKLNHQNLHYISIAAHIRRGDVSKSKNSIRYTSDEAIISRLIEIQRICHSINLQTKITIYSEGHSSDFKVFLSHNFELALNETPLDTLHDLMTADVLLLAKSSFSYIAGLLSDGIVLYDDHWRQKKESWISSRDEKDFGDQLSLKIKELASSRRSLK